ncbi:hypothetical protein HAX54_004505, partial [Datura stramonium]|nr:hypothetical protein [Datura stramonium]
MPIPIPQIKTIYGLKSVHEWGKKWYKKFTLTDYSHDRAINEGDRFIASPIEIVTLRLSK